MNVFNANENVNYHVHFYFHFFLLMFFLLFFFSLLGLSCSFFSPFITRAFRMGAGVPEARV